jgi:hypothetical protein
VIKGVLLDHMGSGRDNDGRLNMDAVRDEREGVSTQYTAEWLSNVQMPPKAIRLEFLGLPLH